MNFEQKQEQERRTKSLITAVSIYLDHLMEKEGVAYLEELSDANAQHLAHMYNNYEGCNRYATRAKEHNPLEG